MPTVHRTGGLRMTGTEPFVDRLLDLTLVGYTRLGPAVRRRLPGWPDDPPAGALAGKHVRSTRARRPTPGASAPRSSCSATCSSGGASTASPSTRPTQGWVETPGVRESLPRFAKLTGRVLREPEDGTETTTWLLARKPRPEGGLWHDRRRRPTTYLGRNGASEAERDTMWRAVLAATNLDRSTR